MDYLVMAQEYEASLVQCQDILEKKRADLKRCKNADDEKTVRKKMQMYRAIIRDLKIGIGFLRQRGEKYNGRNTVSRSV